MIKKINFLFVTCLGIGTLRYAPGSITFVTTLLYSLFHVVNLPNNLILFSLALFFIYSFYAENYIKNNEDKDPKEV